MTAATNRASCESPQKVKEDDVCAEDLMINPYTVNETKTQTSAMNSKVISQNIQPQKDPSPPHFKTKAAQIINNMRNQATQAF